MNFLRLLVFAALPCATLVAQGGDEAVISGLIINSANGRPVVRSGVVVRRIGPGRETASAPTFADGRFTLNLPAGSYRLEASAPGFQRATLSVLTVAAGERREDLRIRLTPLLGISGVIVGSDGEPVAGALIELFDPADGASGRQATHARQSSTTNDRGEYRMQAVPAGRYLVKVSADVRRDGLAYLGLFHPGVAALADAQPVNVVPGAADAEVDFVLPVIRPVKLRLRVDGQGEEWAQFTAVAADAPLSRPQPLLLNRIDAGDYATAITPGAWRIAASYTRDGREYRDVQTVTVQGDEQEVVFTPRRGIDLDGVLLVEGGTAAQRSAITVSLDPADEVPTEGSRPIGRPAADGRYSLRGILAGDWRLMVGALPEGAYLKSIQLAGRDLPDVVLAINSDTRGPLRVVVSLRGARLRGRAADAIGGVVMLVPRDATMATCRTAPVDPEGRFELTGVAPGEYRAYALDAPPPNACGDPQDATQSSVEPVTVRVEEGANVELTFRGAP